MDPLAVCVYGADKSPAPSRYDTIRRVVSHHLPLLFAMKTTEASTPFCQILQVTYSTQRVVTDAGVNNSLSVSL